ncbi:MAG TPA: hypothetical protein PK357_03385 [Candidatus Pacearchaeota archaeon]|nr:hypothetical protein [Candidatus Pacearchaeota archaeon]
MEKEMKNETESKESISFLRQLIMTLEESELKLEEAYAKKSPIQFKNMKDFTLKIQNKISEELS